MTLYFAYGSNMNRGVMGRHCPTAQPLGLATLDHHRFLINSDSYATVVRRRGERVHGVLWRVTARDVAALNVYESIDTGLYTAETAMVRSDGRSHRALVYVGRSRIEGVPRPGYLDLVVHAARDWRLPADYVSALAQWAPSRLKAARAPESGEVA